MRRGRGGPRGVAARFPGCVCAWRWGVRRGEGGRGLSRCGKCGAVVLLFLREFGGRWGEALFFSLRIWRICEKVIPLHPQAWSLQRVFGCWGAIAQLVEQRTENPCVPGSIPGGTTR